MKHLTVMRRLLVVPIALAVIGVLPATSGAAAAAPTWTVVTDSGGKNIDEVSLARTSDGVLHVLWLKHGGIGHEEIRHTPISADGNVGETNVASGGWSAAGNPDVIPTSDGGLRVFFGGLTGVNQRDGAQSASAGADGATWTPEPGRVSSTVSSISDVGAALRADGTPVYSYTYSFVLGLHSGLDPGVTDTDLLPENKCCAYHPDVAFSESGEGYVGWYSNVDGEAGLYVQQIAPTQGEKQLVPQSVTNGKLLSIDQRMPIVARKGEPGIFVAYCSGYPSCTSVLLWKLGTTTPVTVAYGRQIRFVNVAAAPDGRIWVMWADMAGPQLYAARSNAAVTRMGAPAVFDPAPGATAIWRMAGDATDEALDVLASMSTPGSLATWHTRVLPGISVSAGFAKKKVNFIITDAGAPMKGAKIRFGKRTLTTDRRGRATGVGKATTVEVSKTGYTTQSVKLTKDEPPAPPTS